MASVRAELTAVQETVFALARAVRFPDEQTARSLAETERRLGSMLASEAQRVCSLLDSQAQSIRSSIANHIDPILSWDLDRWKIREYEGLIRFFRRKEYFEAIREGKLAVPRLETQHPVAIDSIDTKFPRGCKNDNSIALRFNHKLYEFLNARPHLRVLDLGCAGGGFVRSLIDDGHFAVGLEGSDYPLVNQTGEWSTIPKHLFTCDISQPFHLFDSGTDEPLRFDAITAWELMEHIPEDGLGCLLENIDRHLAPHGYLLFSIATYQDWDPETGTCWHVTIKPRDWWEELYARHGFVIEDQHPFGKDDWLRGSGLCRYDWNGEAGKGFHVVLRRRTAGDSWRQSSNHWLAPVA
jgi:SAM-dependent methyltransferase